LTSGDHSTRWEDRLKRGAEIELDQRIPDELPLLRALVEEWAGGGRPLAGVTAVLIQHQLGSMVPTVRTLLELGLDPARTQLIDIPYTANATVREALEALGIPAGNFAPSTYTLEVPYAPYQRRRVQALIGRLRSEIATDEPLLVLDDGAYFLEAIACYAKPLGDLRLVEQTTRGLIKLELDAALNEYVHSIALVDVARSRPKARLEGPWIGESVCRALCVGLAERPLRTGDRCLILGYGTVGRAVAHTLELDLGVPPSRIYVHDPERRADARARDDCHPLWEPRGPERLRFNLVVGCAGRSSFAVGDRVFLEDGAVLASASSGSAELSREQFVELADTHEDDDIRVLDRGTLGTRSIHDPIDIRLVDRTVRLLNGGFPVNFDGRVNCVPPNNIQVTRALMLGAAMQAVATEERGVIALDPALCQWVERTYAALATA
jgi:S-adenosylhomocysteine hydrolase